MKKENTNQNMEQELKELTNRDLLTIKVAIGLFVTVLNICFLQLIF